MKARTTLHLGLSLGLLAGLPAWAKPTPKPPAAPVVTSAPLPERPSAEALFDDASQWEARTRQEWSSAAGLAAHELETNPQSAQDWAKLGRALEQGGLPYAALTAYLHAADLDAWRVSPWFDRILALSSTLSEDAWTGSILGRDLSVPMSVDTRDGVALTAARHAFAGEHWSETLAMLALIGPDRPLGLDASVLKGVTLAQQRQYTDAIPLLATAYERARQDKRPERTIATLALNTARVFYAAGNRDQAESYDDRVPRSDPAWPEAQFEAAWASFRAQDMDGTLSRLQSLITPFFAYEWLPEAELLRAQALYLLCKFPDATTAIDAFQERWTPVRDQLDQALRTLDATAAVKAAQATLAGQASVLPAVAWQDLQTDQNTRDSIDALKKGEAELDRLRRHGGDWALLAADTLGARLQARTEAKGLALIAQAQARKDLLTDMLADIELTRVDLLSLQADLYSRAAVTGHVEAPARRATKGRQSLTPSNHRVWPYASEVWADELGYYRIKTPSECPASLTNGH